MEQGESFTRLLPKTLRENRVMTIRVYKLKHIPQQLGQTTQKANPGILSQLKAEREKASKAKPV